MFLCRLMIALPFGTVRVTDKIVRVTYVGQICPKVKCRHATAGAAKAFPVTGCRDRRRSQMAG